MFATHFLKNDIMDPCGILSQEAARSSTVVAMVSPIVQICLELFVQRNFFCDSLVSAGRNRGLVGCSYCFRQMRKKPVTRLISERGEEYNYPGNPGAALQDWREDQQRLDFFLMSLLPSLNVVHGADGSV